MILRRILADPLFLQSAKDFPRLMVDRMIDRMIDPVLLFEDHTRHHLVTWAPEDIGKDLEHLRTVKGEARFTMTIIGDIDRLRLARHHLDLPLALPQGGPLHRFTRIDLAWLGLGLAPLDLDHMIRVPRDLLVRDPDLLHDANGRR